MSVFDTEFFPTPGDVIRKMALPYASRLHKATILEPSAGNGAILDYVTGTGVPYEVVLSGRRFDDVRKAAGRRCYAIEKDPDLVAVLHQKGYKVIATDFLSFTPEHGFDLILMNPPFSRGADHLLHAWDILGGGDIACLLNAETVRNPFTAARRRLAAIIGEHGSVEFIGRPFADSDHPTDVEVALVRLHKVPRVDSFRFDPEVFTHETAPDFSEMSAGTGLPAVSDRLDAFVRCWEHTKAAAEEFIRSWQKLRFHADAFVPGNGHLDGGRIVGPLLKSLAEAGYDRTGTTMQDIYNGFLDEAKSVAWNAIISQIGLGKYMTRGLQENLDKFRTAQGAMSISRENIESLFRFIFANRETIMRNCVTEVYDLFTRYYKGNTSCEEGWKTNKRFRCNRKVILPDAVSAGFMPEKYGYDKYFSTSHGSRLDDIDKAMCHLTGKDFDGLTGEIDVPVTEYPGLTRTVPCAANRTIEQTVSLIAVGDQGWHESAFFRVRAFKKGTLHLEFKDQDLLDRFTICVNDGKRELGMAE